MRSAACRRCNIPVGHGSVCLARRCVKRWPPNVRSSPPRGGLHWWGASSTVEAVRHEGLRPIGRCKGDGMSDGEGQAKRVEEKVLVVVAVLISAFGVVMIAGVLIGILNHTSKYTLLTDVMLTLLFGVLPLFGGVWLYRRVRANTATRKADEWERTVVQVAKRHRGMVTAMDVASSSVMTLEQAKATLDQLNLKGFNEMDVSDLGTIVYKFPV